MPRAISVRVGEPARLMYFEATYRQGERAMNEAQKQMRLKRINQKGLAVATKLSEVLAGKDIDLSQLGDLSGIDPNDKKERRLRAYLDTINAARKRLQTADYGRCLKCPDALTDAVLDEAPWTTVCRNCLALYPD